MLPKTDQLSETLLTSLQWSGGNAVDATRPGTRKQQLARQRQKIQETLDALQKVTQERDQLREEVLRAGDYADRALASAETAQARVLVLESQLKERDFRMQELTIENEALIEQGLSMAERLDLAETRWRLLLAE